MAARRKAEFMIDAVPPGRPHPAQSFTFSGRLSVRFALVGIRAMLASQHNAWVHAGASIAVIITAFALRVDRIEWCMLILAMMAVWTAEALNTAFEFLCDVASPDFHPMVARSKDVAAGAVLLSAIGSVVVKNLRRRTRNHGVIMRRNPCLQISCVGLRPFFCCARRELNDEVRICFFRTSAPCVPAVNNPR